VLRRIVSPEREEVARAEGNYIMSEILLKKTCATLFLYPPGNYPFQKKYQVYYLLLWNMFLI
jgi:hypothetical protein